MSTPTSASLPTLPNTTAALRFEPRSFPRFVGEPLNAAPNSLCDMPNSSRASCRASLPSSASRGAKGEPAGDRLAYPMFQGEVVWHTSHPFCPSAPVAKGRA